MNYFVNILLLYKKGGRLCTANVSSYFKGGGKEIELCYYISLIFFAIVFEGKSWERLMSVLRLEGWK